TFGRIAGKNAAHYALSQGVEHEC
ncbi:hypothetical protein, partial [Acinetobacter baumannii]